MPTPGYIPAGHKELSWQETKDGFLGGGEEITQLEGGCQPCPSFEMQLRLCFGFLPSETSPGSLVLRRERKYFVHAQRHLLLVLSY